MLHEAPAVLQELFDGRRQHAAPFLAHAPENHRMNGVPAHLSNVLRSHHGARARRRGAIESGCAAVHGLAVNCLDLASIEKRKHLACGFKTALGSGPRRGGRRAP